MRKYAAQLASAEGKTLEEFEADFKATLDRDGIPPMYEGPSSAEIKLYQQYVGWRDFFYNVPLYLYNGIAGLAGAAKFGWVLGIGCRLHCTSDKNHLPIALAPSTMVGATL